MSQFNDYIAELKTHYKNGTDADVHSAFKVIEALREILPDVSEDEMRTLMDLAIHPIQEGPHPHLHLGSTAVTLLAEIAYQYPTKSRTAVKCLENIAYWSPDVKFRAVSELKAIVKIFENEILNPRGAAIFAPHCEGATDAQERQAFAYQALVNCAGYELGGAQDIGATYALKELRTLKADFRKVAEVIEQIEAMQTTRSTKLNGPQS